MSLLTRSEVEELLRVHVGMSDLTHDTKYKGKLKSGYYHFELYVNLSAKQQGLLGKSKCTQKIHVKTKRDAESERRRFGERVSAQIETAAIHAGLISASGRQTLSERAHSYVDSLPAHISPQSKRNKANLLVYVDQTIGDKPIGDVTVTDIQECIDLVPEISLRRAEERYAERMAMRKHGPNAARAKYKKPLTPPKPAGADIQNKLLVFIASVFKDASERGLVGHNPAQASTLRKRYPKSKAKIQPFTSDEAALIRDGIEALPLGATRVAFRILLACGMRCSEVLGLQFQDLDLGDEYPQLRVVRTMTIDGPGAGKTPSAHRAIPLDQATADLLQEWKRVCQEYARSIPGIRFSERWYVCAEPGDDRPVLYDTLKKRWRKFLNRQGIEYRSLHQIRHTWATILLGAGVDVKTLAVLMGHSSTQMVLDNYAGYLHANALDVTSRYMDVLDGTEVTAV